MKTEPNGSINPIYLGQDGNLGTTCGGLTKREEFAKAAMIGLLSDSARSGTWAEYANDAVELADALIDALDKEKI